MKTISMFTNRPRYTDSSAYLDGRGIFVHSHIARRMIDQGDGEGAWPQWSSDRFASVDVYLSLKLSERSL